jgi:ABC-2 type transport system permease protein
MTTLSTCWTLFVASLRGQMQYRANFVIDVIMGLVYQGTGVLFLWIVLSRFRALGGWTLGEIAFLYGLRLVIHGMQGIFFGSLIQVDRKVRLGEFDQYLTRPLSPLLQIMAQPNRTINLLGDLLGGIALFVAANSLIRIDWSAFSVGYLVLAIVGGGFVEGATMLGVASLSFRFVNVSNLFYLVEGIGFNNFGNYPFTIYGGLLRFLLTFGLPLAFVAYFPATVILGRTEELSVPRAFAYLAPLAGVFWFGLAHRFWKREIRRYQSSGS